MTDARAASPRFIALMAAALALGGVALSAAPALAADPAPRASNPFSRLFAPRTVPPEERLPVPGYIAREADREGPLDLERDTPDHGRRSIGAAVDRYLYGLPISPEDELERKYIRSQNPASRAPRNKGVFDGLSQVGATLGSAVGPRREGALPNGAVIASPPDSRTVFTDGRRTNAAPRIQDVRPLCDDPRTLADILRRFNWAQRESWHSDLRMVAIERPHENGYRTVGDHMVLSKRYCNATAVLSNGHRSRMVYQIVEDTGGAGGFYDRARWCVAGQDRMNQHEPSCRVLRNF